VIDHVIVGTGDFAASKAFYQRALEPFGMSVVMEFGQGCGFGKEGKPWFWVTDRPAPGEGSLHVAFTAPDHATVDAFHREALAAGGTDNGPPGLREHYHPTYYAAFVLDPDGNNIEAVSHRPEA
jgi:catechol 2,3-dioxygenase-like lactoylglutathione lyase family enzyme